MKIVIRDKKERKNVVLYFPLSFIKMPFVIKKLNSSNNINLPEENKELLNKIYKVLKRFVKENGHFNLVEINENNGDVVLIRI